jgi:hypothetical protein
LLAKSQVLNKKPATSAKETKKGAYQKADDIYHVMVLSHSACGPQRSILLKSQADIILANDSYEILSAIGAGGMG